MIIITSFCIAHNFKQARLRGAELESESGQYSVTKPLIHLRRCGGVIQRDPDILKKYGAVYDFQKLIVNSIKVNSSLISIKTKSLQIVHKKTIFRMLF